MQCMVIMIVPEVSPFSSGETTRTLKDQPIRIMFNTNPELLIPRPADLALEQEARSHKSCEPVFLRQSMGRSPFSSHRGAAQCGPLVYDRVCA